MPALDLYRSPWFRKARAYVESTGDPWMILSAKHGLVEPGRRLQPYDVTLRQMTAVQRTRWARRVMEQLSDRCHPGNHVVFLAGETYRRDLVPALRQSGVEVSVPMRGLGIGRQLRWLDRRRRSEERRSGRARA